MRKKGRVTAHAASEAVPPDVAAARTGPFATNHETIMGAALPLAVAYPPLFRKLSVSFSLPRSRSGTATAHENAKNISGNFPQTEKR
jgi:hypothetical protein